MIIPSLSQKEIAIFQLLGTSQGKQLHGLEMVNGSNGALKKGTIYVTLYRMQDKGYVESLVVDTPEGQKGPPRRKYMLTKVGDKIHAALIIMALALES